VTGTPSYTLAASSALDARHACFLAATAIHRRLYSCCHNCCCCKQPRKLFKVKKDVCCLPVQSPAHQS
jgi:hypothetical protein